MSIENFNTKIEAENTLKYIKTKFARELLGILKATQANRRPKWKWVPMQNFTIKYDIDWSESISTNDKQLYANYNLSESEIQFIEDKVRPME